LRISKTRKELRTGLPKMPLHLCPEIDETGTNKNENAKYPHVFQRVF
jgi:hypothetical protein